MTTESSANGLGTESQYIQQYIMTSRIIDRRRGEHDWRRRGEHDWQEEVTDDWQEEGQAWLTGGGASMIDRRRGEHDWQEEGEIWLTGGGASMIDRRREEHVRQKEGEEVKPHGHVNTNKTR